MRGRLLHWAEAVAYVPLRYSRIDSIELFCTYAVRTFLHSYIHYMPTQLTSGLTRSSAVFPVSLAGSVAKTWFAATLPLIALEVKR